MYRHICDRRGHDCDILFLRSVWQETGRSYLYRTKYRWLMVLVGSRDTYMYVW
jgi:hypothetical protein